MSHFTVLVIGDNVDEQLYPYCELECSMNQEQIKNDPRSKFVQEFTTEELEKDFIKVKNEQPEEYFETLEEFAEEYHGYQKDDDTDGWGSRTNPNSKWDWYSIGGRWSGIFKVKNKPKYPDDLVIGKRGTFDNIPKKGYVDSARLCDIDFDGMKLDGIENATKNWKEAQQKILKGEKNIEIIYGIDDDDTEESYVKKNTEFSAYALIKDKKWYAKGEMGWFGVSNDKIDNWTEELNTLITSLPEDTLLTLVDCHI